MARDNFGTRLFTVRAGKVASQMEAGEHHLQWETSRLGYRPALDGVRAFAVSAVLAVHAGLLRGGFFGVDIFFVLSGFLITSLLIEEWVRTGTVSRRAFYARRARRLLPALFLTIARVGLLYGLFPEQDRGIGYLWSAFGAAFYFGNWAEAFHSHGPVGDLGLLTHTWSLAIEEQFYIVWPLEKGTVALEFVSVTIGQTDSDEVPQREEMSP